MDTTRRNIIEVILICQKAILAVLIFLTLVGGYYVWFGWSKLGTQIILTIGLALFVIVTVTVGYGLGKVIKVLLPPIRDILRRIRQLENIENARVKLYDPIDRYITEQYIISTPANHFHRHYDEWRGRRIAKILELHGLDFQGLKILELGGGHGDIGAFFASLGAEVVSAEARAYNRNFANIKYRNIPSFQSVDCNLGTDFTHLGHFDLIINFGFLEVVEDASLVIDCCTQMSDNIFLETMCCDSLDDRKLIVEYLDPSGGDHPLHGKSARPSPSYIERLFVERGFSVERCFHSDLNTSMSLYDWEHRDDDSCDTTLRRFWRFTRSGKQN